MHGLNPSHSPPSLAPSYPPDARRRRAGFAAAGACLGLAVAVPAHAEPENPAVATVTGSGPLETTITAETLHVLSRPGDQELRIFSPASRLSAGDEVHYTVRVRNPGDRPVTDIVVTKRLPFGVRYQTGSAAGPACDIQFSHDGGRTFHRPEPPARSNDTSRKTVARTGTPSDYSHVRWILHKPLAPGATALLRFRATFS